MNFKFKKQGGFTLIELIVVMAVFFFIVGAVIGIFISIIQNQKKVLAEQQLLNQISYVEEHMSKALRMASTDEYGSCIPEGYIYLLMRQPSNDVYTGIKFIDRSDDNACKTFSWVDGVLKETKNNGNPVPITSSVLQINSVRFSVNGLDGSVSGQGCIGDSDNCGAISNVSSTVKQPQPRVTMLLDVKVPGDSGNPARTIQTTVSQRNLNIEY
jgi:type II secretory pathway pseudopilin PulG